MKNVLIAVIAFSVIALAASTVLGQSGHDLFQKALVKERAEGDLQEAIDIYRRIVREFGADRALAAEALVHMGQCYEKLGNEEARKAYEQVVREYADQAEPLRVARARLAALAEPETKEMTVRKVFSGPGVDVEGQVSPDGRHLSFVNWTTGDLAARNLKTGQNRRLTDKGTWAESQDFALFSRWSPDGKKIAYDWYVNVLSGGRPESRNELRIVTVEDSQSRVLYKPPDKTFVVTCDWSPDGKEVLAVLGSEEGTDLRLVVIAVAGGSVRVLKQIGRDYPFPSAFVFSPDGRHILYGMTADARAPEGDMFLLASDGSGETRVEHPANELALGWSPDGRWALFLSDRTGTLDLWALPVLDGKPDGEPRLIKPGVGRVVPLGVNADGSFHYGTLSESDNIYVARLDPSTGRILTPAVRAIRRFEGRNTWPCYSRDGKQLAYVSARRSLSMFQKRYNVLCVRSLETGDEREFVTEFARLAGPQWSPDGLAVLVYGRDFQGAAGIYRVDAQTGELTPVVRAKSPASIHFHDLRPDGETLYYMRRDKQGEPWKIMARDLASGHERELYSGPPGDRFVAALSPDGERLAFLSWAAQVEGERALSVLSVTGGEPRELYRFKQFGNLGVPLAWSADGKYLLFPKQRYEVVKEQIERGRQATTSEADLAEPEWSLWRVPASGGEAQDLELEMPLGGGLDVHPDGQQIVFASRSGTPGSEVWVMENFLPEQAAGRR